MKMIRTSVAFCLTTVIVFTVISCSAKEDSFPIDHDEKYLNQQITLKAPNYSNTFRTADAINVEITNNSAQEVVFPNNYNIRMFFETDTGWVEISETPTTRLPDGDFVLSPNVGIPTIENTFIVPDFPDLTKSYHLRIYVFGNMKTTNENIEVAAFTDVVLRP